MKDSDSLRAYREEWQRMEDEILAELCRENGHWWEGILRQKCVNCGVDRRSWKRRPEQ